MSAEFKETLLNSIKPDLNLLYSSKPFSAQGAPDFGWFCREHAYNIFLTGRLLELNCEIVVGSVQIQSKQRLLSTLKMNDGHVWCSINNISPVDASIFLNHFPDFPSVNLVYGMGNELSNPYHILYEIESGGKTPEDFIQPEDYAIVYLEDHKIILDPLELVQNPYSFLLLPPPGMKKLTDIYGDDIFAAITLHCFKLANNETKALSRYSDRNQAINKILDWNRDSCEQLIHMLTK